MNKIIPVSIITGVLTLFVGFFGGYTYQKGKQQNFRPENLQMGMVNGARAENGTASARNSLLKGNTPVSGKIISMDSTSITVQTKDGSNKIVLLTDQTKINETTEASKDNLKVGIDVMVIGNTTNGAVMAQSISLGAPISTTTIK